MARAENKKRVAIYCRLSEEDRNKRNETHDSNSIQNQKSMLLEYAIQNDWVVYNIYSDDDYTGADRNRPAFNQMLADAQARRFDIILCKSQSRFTREMELVEKYINGLFPEWGIRFVSIVDNADTDNAGNKKSRQINGLVNQWYLEDMSQSIKSVLVNRRKNGLHIGASALYGYKKDPDQKGHLIIDEEAAAIVREVFTRFAQGYGKNTIACILNDRGVPNPTEYKRLKGYSSRSAPRNSKLWKYFTIADMLANEMYIGNMVQGKYGSISYLSKKNKPRPKEDWYVVENTHEPIIDRALWDQVQTLRKGRSKSFDDGKIGIFAYKTRCAECGYTLRSTRNKGKVYLRCPNRQVSKAACEGAFISVERLERMVLTELRRLGDLYLDRDALAQNLAFDYDLQLQKERLHKDIQTYTQKNEECSKALRDLYLDKVKGILTEDEYIDLSRDFSRDKAHFAQLISDANQRLSELETRISAGNNRKEIIEQYVTTEHLTREMVEHLIDYISVGQRIPGTRNVPIEIHWNF